jgi:glycosyltransferase involved in cell wall biosynthesis
MSSAERYKGHEELIRAWPVVTSSHPDARLRLVGTGDDLPRLRDLAHRCGVADYVYFEGPASEERKLALLSEARGLALLSTDEGFGLAWTEAMAAGTPVLGLQGTVAEELFSHGVEGFLLRDRGQEEIAAAVGSLLCGEEAWNSLSRRARDRWARSFTRDDCVRRLSGEFARLLELSRA